MLLAAIQFQAQECRNWRGIPMGTTKKARAEGNPRLATYDNSRPSQYAALATRRSWWWGRQSCTCHGAGRCLCCRRFDQAIRDHQSRYAVAV